MRTVVLLALFTLASAGEPEFTLELREIAYSQRIEYILGDGEHPFADEDQRRAQVMLGVKTTGRAALLGWGSFKVDEAVSDHDEALGIVPPQPEGVFATAHELQADPAIALPGIPLPLTRQASSALKRFSGSVELRFSAGPPASVRFAAADLAPNQERAIPGIEGGSITFAEPPGADGRIQARLSPPAYLALQDLAFFDAKGGELPARNRRSEWRDNQGQITMWAKSQPTTIELRYYPRISRRTLVFSLPGLALGLALPGREDLRGPTRTGVSGF